MSELNRQRIAAALQERAEQAIPDDLSPSPSVREQWHAAADISHMQAASLPVAERPSDKAIMNRGPRRLVWVLPVLSMMLLLGTVSFWSMSSQSEVQGLFNRGGLPQRSNPGPNQTPMAMMQPIATTGSIPLSESDGILSAPMIGLSRPAQQAQGTVMAVPDQYIDQPSGATGQPAATSEVLVPTEPGVMPTPVPAVQANPFVETSQDRLSTFALDVDTGSYTAARNYIEAGTLPPYSTVRVEEFVNYFRYDYPVPEESAFGIYVDGAPSPFGGQGMQPGSLPNTQIVRVGIQGRRISDAQRKDAVLTFVIDISGSMAEPNRLPLVKQGLRLLVNELRPSDEVGIVTYGDTAALVLEHTKASERDKILQAIDSLQNDGSTNAEEGLRMGYELASKNFKADTINRVILCSDGVANVGETSPEGIRQKIRDYTKQGILLTTVGFGMGDYNDHLMEQLADDGDGNYAYVDTIQEAKRIFVENLTGTLQVIAKDAKLQVEFNPAVVSRYRLIGYENRDVADVDFRNDTVDAGEIGAGHTVTALYEIEMIGANNGPALTVQMRYADPTTGNVTELKEPFEAGEIAADFAAATPRFQLAVAVAAFAEQLRDSPSARSSSLADVLTIAQRIAPLLANDQDVQEFVQLVTKAGVIKGQNP